MTTLAALAVREMAQPEAYLGAEASRRIASRALALASDPSDPALSRLRPVLDYAESTLRTRAATPWWRRDSTAATQAWSQVEAEAAKAAAVLRRRRAEVLGRWPEAERAASQALDSARSYLAAPGNDRRQRSAAVARATVQLERARGLAATGRFAEGIAAAQVSLRESEAVLALWAEAHARFEDPAELRFWRSLVDTAFREAGSKKTHLIVDKLARRLDVYAGSRRIAEFPIELGANGLAQKSHAGDRATPEGRYRVTERRDIGRTRYHRALMLDYPNATDRQRWERARREGRVPRGAGPGSLIEIHGDGGRGVDWTDGCVALTNSEMDRLFAMVPTGTSVTIVGTYDRP